MAIVPALDLRPASNEDVAIAHVPANIEAEQALLGAVLYDNAAFERLGDFLQDRHFYEPFHQRLYQVIETSVRKGQLAEPILIAEQESGALRPDIDLMLLYEWIAELEMMFISQLTAGTGSIDRFRQKLRAFFVPALLRTNHTVN